MELKNPFKNQSRTVTAAIIIGLILLSIGIAAGVTYVLTASTAVPVDVTSGTVYVPVALTTNGTAITDLDRLTLTATTGPNGNGLTVVFRDGVNIVGSATITGGTASITIGPLSIGSHSFTAGP